MAIHAHANRLISTKVLLHGSRKGLLCSQHAKGFGAARDTFEFQKGGLKD